MALQAFSLPQICAPVPADLNLPGSKKAPERVPSFALYHRLPQDSPSRIHAAERHSATIHFSLFSLHSPRPGLPLPLPGSARELLSRGGGGSVPRQQCGTAKRPFPPHSPACRAQACSEPVPQSGTPQLFTLPYSLSQPCPFFPPGRTAKQKYILFFGHLTHNSTRYNIGLNLIMEGKEYGKTGSA